MLPHLGQTMSEDDLAGDVDAQPTPEFVKLEEQLNRETSVIGMMKEQMKSMIGMVSMFVITILLALFIRPWYDVGELHAFGESGATQVRFIFLELIMIFIFTAFVIMLARYKKDWLIKYGIMGVLTIALMYTTIPLMHMLVIDFDVEEFEYQDTYELESTYLTDIGMDGFISHQLIGDYTNWNDSIEYWNAESLQNGQPNWTLDSPRLPAGDNEMLRVVKSQDYLTFANSAWIWSVDIATGEEIERYQCHYLDEGNIRLGTPYGNCDMALVVDSGVYTFSSSGDVQYYPVFNGVIGAPQAEWSLPPYMDIRNEFIDAVQIAEEQLLIVTKKVAMVIHLDETRDDLEIGPVPYEFEYFSESGITASDFGHSPWSEKTLSESMQGEGLIIIGESNGSVSGWEWDDKKPFDERYQYQTSMRLTGFADNITQVQITDLGNTDITDLLITTDSNSHWLYTTLLKNSISFEIENDFQHGVFVTNSSGDHFYSVSETSISSGLITDDMYKLEGIQLYDGPFLAGLILGLLLMILLYFHSEWYVVNTVGVLVGAGVIVMLGVAFVPTLIIIFMILAAIYDAWAVYKSKHMLELADTMIGLQLPILLVAPQDKGYSFKEESKKMSHEPIQQDIQPTKAVQSGKKKSKEALFMGLGDIIFPGMLVLSAVQWLDSDGAFAVAMTTLFGSLLGYFALMTFVARGKAQAGLPLLNGGAILGYFLGGLFFIGTAIFELGISW